MCGIIGIVRAKPKGDLIKELVDGLEVLRYRGYDSAGIAYLQGRRLMLKRRVGRAALAELRERRASSACGIAHTRWATHGEATKANAHPHLSGEVAIVHNGIIENFLAVKDKLKSSGIKFKSQTDSELIVHLINAQLALGLPPRRAFVEALAKLEGSFAVAAIFAGEDGLILAARNKSPLLVGKGGDGYFVASDAVALANKTESFYSLSDGQIAELTANGIEISDFALNRRRAIYKKLDLTVVANKGDHAHFMLKEILEQPQAIDRALKTGLPNLAKPPPKSLALVACGTSYFSALVGRYWLESFSRLDVHVELASEFRYRQPIVPKSRLFIFISQSGETADTLAAFRYVKQLGGKCLAVVNVPHSSLAREVDKVIHTAAGAEIGVASTKAFTAQMAVLARLAIGLAPAAKREQGRKHLKTLARVPTVLTGFYGEAVLESLQKLGKRLATQKQILFVGRGKCYPLALEGALKMKEISYIYSIAYASGEMKHGPIALVDAKLPIVMLAPYDELFTKSMSNMEELLSRKGNIFLFSDHAESVRKRHKNLVAFEMPESDPFTMPLLYSPALQLLAYYTALAKGAEIDQPRNLAKSVTVE